jgi:hypothetical protein
MVEPTDIKAIINSIQVVKVNGKNMVVIDQPDKVIVTPENARDAELCGEYLAMAAHEAETLALVEKVNIEDEHD